MGGLGGVDRGYSGVFRWRYIRRVFAVRDADCYL